MRFATSFKQENEAKKLFKNGYAVGSRGECRFWGSRLRPSAIHPEGFVSAVYLPGDEVQIFVNNAYADGSFTATGRVNSFTADSIALLSFSGLNKRIAVRQITRLRRLPTVLSGLAAGAALGATAITLIDKRSSFFGPRFGLSLLLGAGAGVMAAYGQRILQHKRVRHRSARGSSFQVR